MIPNFQSFFQPVLEFHANNPTEEKRQKETVQYVVKYFKLTPEDQAKAFSDGIKVVDSRTQWAKTFLKKAGLLESKRRGYYAITAEGQRVLAEQPERLDNKYLNRYENFRVFAAGKKKEDTQNINMPITQEENTATATPLEQIDSAYQEISEMLKDELLDTLRESDPIFFERIILKVMLAMGYGGREESAAQTTKRTNDGGIDGIINEDVLGLDKIYLQAKRYARDNSVSSREVQAFMGALVGDSVSKGVFITTSSFTKSAISCAEKQNTQSLTLIDGNRLAGLMIEYNVGVVLERAVELKKLDLTFFDDE